MSSRVLIVSHRPMVPPLDGGSRAMYAMASGLRRTSDLELHYCTLCSSSAEMEAVAKQNGGELFARAHALDRVPRNTIVALVRSIVTSRLPFNMWKYVHDDFEKIVIDVVQQIRPRYVILEHLHTAHYVSAIKKVDPKIPVLLRAHNVEHQIMERLAATAPSLVKRAIYSQQARRLKAYEKQAVTWVDQVVALSAHDAKALGELQVLTRRPVEVLPPGVALPDISGRQGTTDKPTPIRLLHFAAMDWAPNEAGLRWFCSDVLPQLSVSGVEFTLDIVGKSMPEWVASRLSASNVTVRGFVEDLDDVYAEADLALVTVRAGSGIRMKILEHAAWGVPVLSTSVGAEGLIDVEESGVLVRDTAEEFVRGIVHLANNRRSLAILSERGRQWVSANYSVTAEAQRMLSLLCRIEAEMAG